MRSVADFPKQALSWLSLRSDEWPIYPLKRVVASNKLALSESTDPDYELKYVDISSVELSEGIKKTEDLTFEHAPSRARRVVRSGDVLVSTVRTYLRAIARVEDAPENLIASTGFAILSPQEKLDSSYFGLFCTSHPFVEAIVAQSTGASYPATNASDIVRLPIPVPPLGLQRKIAAFVERKIKEIDDLIAKKRSLLVLLAEKRSALITRAVTKGLDPEAPTKPSGVDWLSDIPAHWDASFRLKFLTTVSGGLTPATANADYWFGDIPWVSPKDMKVFDVTDSEDHVTELALEETSLSLIDPGAVLLVVRGMILAHTVPIAVNSVAITVNQDMKALRCGDRLTPKFLAYFLRGIERHILSLVETSAHGTKALRSESWRELNVPLPPLDEQFTILSIVDDGLSEIDKSAALIRIAIDQLTEYRAAFITKAVTGELEVV
jgi:type I restriction enzyme, S subunit